MAPTRPGSVGRRRPRHYDPIVQPGPANNDHARSRRIRLDVPLDLRSTLGAVVTSSAPGASRAQETWRAVRTPLGTASIRISRVGSSLAGDAWGEGAEWLLDALPALVGLDDDRSGFVPHHALIERLHHQNPGMRIGRTGLIWEALTPTILGQKVTTAEARRSWRSLVRALGEPAPGPRPMRLGPSPGILATMGYFDFHPHGIEKRRADIIVGCARHAHRIDQAVGLDRSAAYECLLALPGIGHWTAALTLGEALGDPDAVPIGDYHLPNLVCWALAGEPRGDDARMLELLEPYRGHRNRVIRLLSLSGRRPPKFGARTRPRNIRGS